MTEFVFSALIDCVFILLIFFIVTTVFVEEPGVEVEKPAALSAEDLEKNSILIAVTKRGEVVYGGDQIGIAGVHNIVQTEAAKDPEKTVTVIIQVDAESDSEVGIKVVAEARRAGAKTFFSTERN